jgi:hypothetical protein
LALRPTLSFELVLGRDDDGIAFACSGTCVVAVDMQGRESMHLRGVVRRAGREAPLQVLGHVDPARSFVGRERVALLECLARQQQLPGSPLQRAMAAISGTTRCAAARRSAPVGIAGRDADAAGLALAGLQAG